MVKRGFLVVALSCSLGLSLACGGANRSPLAPTALASHASAVSSQPVSPAPSLSSRLLAVISISPSSGPTTGGTPIIISGSEFLEGAIVSFGDTPASDVIVTERTVMATTPPHAEGPVDVVVTNPDGQMAILPGGYTYAADKPPADTPSTDISITITSSGVSPREIEIPVGARVTFVNNDSRSHEIQSDPHPVHTDCPPINEVGLLRPGESKQTGEFLTARACGYHDHSQSSNQALRGRIVVNDWPVSP